MQKVTKQWSQQEKQILNKLVQTNSHNSRVDWVKVSAQLNNRTPTQCKLQYRHVLNKQPQRVNFEWSEEKEKELMMLIHAYGKKWKFLQKNYFPELNSEQLRLKFVQCHKLHQQYKEMFENIENGKELSEKEVKIIKITMNRMQNLRQKIKEYQENQGMLDPLELKLFRSTTEQNFKDFDKEEQKLLNLWNKIKNTQNKETDIQNIKIE
ncbi:Myb-like_DNA-binding domain-containing protein [Hexamita inflata]|uniref:Myb-like DNA-binding domain-containing protein n=1 Tax=Hexamita inflata TaxID=28002 RepID=A0AA86R2P0_9EUKA|nr:Myb-like DNA-binding domain-containing protein [Hexamita inflata]